MNKKKSNFYRIASLSQPLAMTHDDATCKVLKKILQYYKYC
jgi:hypothetical protein